MKTSGQLDVIRESCDKCVAAIQRAREKQPSRDELMDACTMIILVVRGLMDEMQADGEELVRLRALLGAKEVC